MNSSNRTILITGATSGIGYQAAIRMIDLGNHLIITCRNKLRKEQLYRNLKKDLKSFKDNVSLPIVDLSDLRSIESFANELTSSSNSIDSLILNAGLQYTGSDSAKWSKQGIELTFAVNHLAHFYLTNKLLGLLLKSDSPRIIVTASEVHNPTLPGGRIGSPAGLVNLEGLESGIGFKMVDGSSTFNADKAYKDSKLCNILFSKELSRRISISNMTCPVISWAPGLVIPRSREGFFRHSRINNEIGQRLFAFAARDILRITETPQKAGEILMNIERSKEYVDKPFIYLSNQLISFSRHELKEAETSFESNDLNKAEKLWQLTYDLLNKLNY